MSVASPVYTPEDLLRMPDSSTFELVGGQIVEKNVTLQSCEIEGMFFFRFKNFVMNHPIAEAFPGSLGYQCFDDDPGKVRKPDTTVVLCDRLKPLPNPNYGFMPIVPDLAVEVISRNDKVYDIDGKVQEYLDAGFPLIWVADPKAKTITVYPRGGRPSIFAADDEITTEAVLPGFRCKVADFFPAPITIEKKGSSLPTR